MFEGIFNRKQPVHPDDIVDEIEKVEGGASDMEETELPGNENEAGKENDELPKAA